MKILGFKSDRNKYMTALNNESKRYPDKIDIFFLFTFVFSMIIGGWIASVLFHGLFSMLDLCVGAFAGAGGYVMIQKIADKKRQQVSQEISTNIIIEDMHKTFSEDTVRNDIPTMNSSDK